MPPNIVNHTETEVIIHKSFKTAEDFINALSPMSDLWGGNSSDWIFRGHGDDASWKLIPSALRDNPPPLWKVGNKLHEGLWPTNRDQAIAEFDVVRKLARLLDEQGISFPGKDPVLRTRHARLHQSWQINDDELFQFPPEEYLPLFAIAQHHGVPTRLLDWSESAWTAAYFAAEFWMRENVHKGCEKELGVWALRSSFFLQNEHVQNFSIDLITVPWAATPNLCAQKGYFTVERPIFRGDDQPRVKPLIDTIKALAKKASRWSNIENHIIQMPLMYHLRLPVTQAKRLLRLLHWHGASGVTLFPGYAGAAKAVFEMNAWED